MIDEPDSIEPTQEEISQYFNDLERINVLVALGHARHCGCRQVWGDGECECDLYLKGYDPYKWMRGGK